MVPEEVPRGHSNTVGLRHRAQKVFFYVISIRSGSETRYNRFQRVVSPVLAERERESLDFLVAVRVRAHAPARHSARDDVRTRRNGTTSNPSRAPAGGHGRAAQWRARERDG